MNKRAGVQGSWVSDDLFNHGPAGLIVLIPMTSRARGVPLHVRIDPPEGGVSVVSYIKCEDVRSVSKERLGRRWGAVGGPTMVAVEDRLRILLGL